MVVRSSILLLLIVVVAAAQDDDATCGLYLAESSTSTTKDPKLGIFAGKDYDAKSPIGPPEIAIQIPNMQSHMRRKPMPLQKAVADVEQYFWTSESTGAAWEVKAEGGRVITAIPGAGVLGNYHPFLINSDWNQFSGHFRKMKGASMSPKKPHVGRGAYTTYFNVTIQSTQAIQAGVEIFANYGEQWEENNKKEDAEEEDEDDTTVKRKDYNKLDAVVDQVLDFLETHKSELTPEAEKDIYHFLTRDVLQAATGSKSQKLVDLLPKRPQELQKVKDAGGVLIYNEPEIRKDLQWLEENGRCMDLLEPGPSTIPHAGLGAFAKRNLSKGSLVAPAPLIHIPDGETMMDMYRLDWVETEDGDEVMAPINKKVINKQLILNYCFGHKDSSMLFLPFGMNTNLINHASGDKANVKLTWSTMEFNQFKWQGLSPRELSSPKYSRVGLVMDIVATKDIKKGDEIFLDYGPEWQEAWDRHVQQWKDRLDLGDIRSEWPLRALEITPKYLDGGAPYRIPSELQKKPYPSKVLLVAFIVMEDVPLGEKRRETDGTPIRKWAGDSKAAFQGEFMYTCTVLEREQVDGSYVYKLEIEHVDEVFHIVGVPHRAIKFVDKPEQSDQFMPHVFRHKIGIPDSMFPEVWKTKGGEEPADEKEEEEEEEYYEGDDEFEIYEE